MEREARGRRSGEREPFAALLLDGGRDAGRPLHPLLELAAPAGSRLERAADAEAALARLAAGGVDVVLIALSAPERGAALVHRLRSAHPAVALVGLAPREQLGLRREALAAGLEECLVAEETDARALAAALRHARRWRSLAAELAACQARCALTARGTNDGSWYWDRATDRVRLSPRWLEMLGRSGEEADGSTEAWLAQVVDEDRPQLRAALAAQAAGGEEIFELEHRMRHRDGRELSVLLRGAVARDARGQASAMAGSLTDLTAHKRAERQIRHDALHDALTGLPNRALFLDRLSLALASARRPDGAAFAVLVLDVDRFQTINDSLGHPAGDRLLVEIARRLRHLVRPSDPVARLGGDEFAVLAAGSRDGKGAVHLAERIQQELSRPFQIESEEVFAGASIGIALPAGDETQSETTAEGLLRDADLAMYRAKAAGRGRYEVYDQELHAAAVELLKLERELRRAVVAGDFVMHYQPIVSLAAGGIVGFEALTRWRHPERGLVAPAHFIAIAEETGLIVPLGWRVLEWACAQAREWQRRFPADPPYFMSVNVSGKLFAEESAVGKVLGILESSGLAPESLRLEVTESVVLDHGEAVMARLRMLQAMGVQLSIDDFGTGYSSLSYLQRFRYDSLKIDRSFVRDIEVQDSRVIVETILALASHLGIGVVAEGVETGEQLARLRALGCPLGQGYWFARPLDVTAAEALLTAGSVW